MRLRLICMALLFGLAACQQQPPPAPAPIDPELIVMEVEAMLYKYHHAIGERGLEAEFDYLDDSESFFWIPPGYSAPLDYDSVATVLRKNAKRYEDIEFVWKALEVYPISATCATYSGIVFGVMTDTTGQVSQVNLLESGTLIKRDSGWKLLSGQSAILPE